MCNGLISFRSQMPSAYRNVSPGGESLEDFFDKERITLGQRENGIEKRLADREPAASQGSPAAFGPPAMGSWAASANSVPSRSRSSSARK